MFEQIDNPEGCKRILGELPKGERYGDLACACFSAVMRMNKAYFDDDISYISGVPDDFGLVGLGVPISRVSVACEIYRIVLGIDGAHYNLGEGNEEVDLAWLASAPSPYVTAYVVQLLRWVFVFDLFS